MTTASASDQTQQPQVERMEHEPMPRIPVRRYWIYPLIGGSAIVLLAAWIMVVSAGTVWWGLCGLPVLLLGTFTLWLAESARSGHWVYVNVKDKDKEGSHHVRVMSPLPIGLARGGLWFARQVRPQVNDLFDARGIDPDGILNALDQSLKDDEGISIEVDDDDSEVQVYIV